LSSIGGSAASYDARENLTADPTSGKAYTYWPSDNALWTVSAPWTALSYDPLGRLALIDSASDTGFAYDGLDMIAEYNSAGTMLARYVHGPGIDQPLVRYDGSGTSNKQSLHADERGSIVAISYGSPYAPTLNRYDEYGKPQAGNIGRFQYTGQMWLGEVGLYHSKARAYSPTFGGRFLQTDPNGYGSGINLYAYVGNDPVNFTDPLGLCTGSLISNSDGSCMGGGFIAGPMSGWTTGTSPAPAGRRGEPGPIYVTRDGVTVIATGRGAANGGVREEGEDIVVPGIRQSDGYYECINCGQLGTLNPNGEIVVRAPTYKWAPGTSGKGPPPGFPTAFNYSACDWQCQREIEITMCLAEGLAHPGGADVLDEAARAAGQIHRYTEYTTWAAANIVLFNVGATITRCRRGN
jgi:RHS repeat-associated protein